MQLTDEQKKLLTQIKSELIEQEVEDGLVDPMNMIEMGEELDRANRKIAEYLQEEE